MWVKGVTDDTQTRFSVVYISMIKNKLRKRYEEYYAFFKEPVSLEDLEQDIKLLLESYTSKKKYTRYNTTIPIYIKENKILKSNLVEKRLNALVYALSNLSKDMDAFYVIQPLSDINVEFKEPSMLNYKIRLVDFSMLFIIIILLYYFGYMSLNNSIILLSSMVLLMYIILYKL